MDGKKAREKFSQLSLDDQRLYQQAMYKLSLLDSETRNKIITFFEKLHQNRIRKEMIKEIIKNTN